MAQGPGDNDSKIHVVYDTAQVYPAYIVTYALRPPAVMASPAAPPMPV